MSPSKARNNECHWRWQHPQTCSWPSWILETQTLTAYVAQEKHAKSPDNESSSTQAPKSPPEWDIRPTSPGTRDADGPPARPKCPQPHTPTTNPQTQAPASNPPSTKPSQAQSTSAAIREIRHATYCTSLAMQREMPRR
jgi:hypothetical protein